MITGEVDAKLDSSRLEQEMDSFRREVEDKEVSQWYLCEIYEDRAKLDPFYTLEFHSDVDDPGDDLRNAKLFRVSSTLSANTITRAKEPQCKDYWQPVSREELLGRLDRFMTMYNENYIQPPGCWGQPFDATQEHPRFKGKRFLFKITSPSRPITGIGPKMFAGSIITGRLCDENEIPLANKTLILKQDDKEVDCQTTDEAGLFRFEGLGSGAYQIEVPGYHINARTIVGGSIQGNLTDVPWPVKIELVAQEKVAITTWSDATGAFQFEGLVSGQYKLRSPGLLLSEIGDEGRLAQ